MAINYEFAHRIAVEWFAQPSARGLSFSGAVSLDLPVSDQTSYASVLLFNRI